MSRGVGRSAFAAAKVNLCLHVGPREADGYHGIASVMVFADVGDRLLVGDGDLDISGAFADGLSAGADNLVARARAAFAQAGGASAPGLILEKTLPIGAGLGGGSADAGAALRLLNAGADRPLSAQALEQIAGRLGADVTACLDSVSVIAEGRGERLSPAPAMPALDAVLVYPGVSSSTPAVYAAFDEMTPAGGDLALPSAERLTTLEGVIAWLNHTRNDLEAPAVRLQPVIGEVLRSLASEPEASLTRMTGSGSAVFSLCRDGAAATRLAQKMRMRRPGWWVRACRLGAA